MFGLVDLMGGSDGWTVVGAGGFWAAGAVRVGVWGVVGGSGLFAVDDRQSAVAAGVVEPLVEGRGAGCWRVDGGNPRSGSCWRAVRLAV